MPDCAGIFEAVAGPEVEVSREESTRVRPLALPDLEDAKTAALNTLTSASSQRT
jgi:hypothetical protein